MADDQEQNLDDGCGCKPRIRLLFNRCSETVLMASVICLGGKFSSSCRPTSLRSSTVQRGQEAAVDLVVEIWQACDLLGVVNRLILPLSSLSAGPQQNMLPFKMKLSSAERKRES